MIIIFNLKTILKQARQPNRFTSITVAHFSISILDYINKTEKLFVHHFKKDG